MSEIKIIDFEEIENLPRNKLEPIYYGDSIIIHLKPCPICGCEKVFMNGTGPTYPKNYAECSNCKTTGPKHWNWVNAAKMWNHRNPETIKEFSPDYAPQDYEGEKW